MIRAKAQYVTRTPAGGWRIAGTRVSLDSLVHAYWSGRSPEEIIADFPSLSAEQVHGALAFYLRNRPLFDRYLAAQSKRWDQLKARSDRTNAPLLRKLRRPRPPCRR